MFSHQNFGHNEAAWLNQHNHQQTHHQAQAAAAAHATAAHYNRIQATHNASVPTHLPGHAQESAMMDGVTEENRRVLVWIAELLNEDTRESALLELSKKREQVPELALILWHSFGKPKFNPTIEALLTWHRRCHDLFVAGDHLRLYVTEPIAIDCSRIQPCLQRACSSPVRGFAQ